MITTVHRRRASGALTWLVYVGVTTIVGFGNLAFANDTSQCGIVPSVPAVPRSPKAVLHPAGPDDTGAIQRALDTLVSGDWLIFSPGTYEIRKHIVVHTDGVTLYGLGATIHAGNSVDGAILIQSDSVSIYNLKLDQDSTTRQSTPWSGGISVFDDRGGGRRQVRGVTIQNNVVSNSAGAGIFLYKADHFTVANNTVIRSWADGIHMTSGSTHGRIIKNTVSQSGDDMIAVVSYAGARAPVTAAVRYSQWAALADALDRDIYIYGNRVSDQYWGRGISVVGGSDVTIEDNYVSRVPGGAGVYIARETAYMTFGDHNILVRNNKITQIQTASASYDPANKNALPNGTGAIEAASELASDERSDSTYRSAFSISDVAIIDNVVDSARFAGIRVGSGEIGSSMAKGPDGVSVPVTWAPGPVSNVVVRGNRISNVNADDVVAEYPGLDATAISCSDNVLNGKATARQCTAKDSSTQRPVIPAVGASIQCTIEGAISGSPERSTPGYAPR